MPKLICKYQKIPYGYELVATMIDGQTESTSVHYFTSRTKAEKRELSIFHLIKPGDVFTSTKEWGDRNGNALKT